MALDYEQVALVTPLDVSRWLSPGGDSRHWGDRRHWGGGTAGEEGTGGEEGTAGTRGTGGTGGTAGTGGTGGTGWDRRHLVGQESKLSHS